MRVAHIGNINNNGYLITKFLRQKNFEADLYVHSYDYWMAYPEWEEGVFDVEITPTRYPKWSWIALQNGWERPPWVKEMPPSTWHRLPYGKLDHFIEQMEYKLNAALQYRQHRIVNEGLRRRGLPELDFAQVSQYFDIYRWEHIVRDYDIVQIYGLFDALHCLPGFPPKPYIVYDYGQPLRSMVWEESLQGRLFRAVYEHADSVVITNADTRECAQRLGLKNYRFIPCPVDETKFCPGESRLRKELEAKYGRDIVVLFAPARQDWAEKGNDRMLKAFVQLQVWGKARTILIVADWGKDVFKAHELVEKAGLETNVLWTRPLNRTTLVDYYRAADIVLDQFVLGTYGGKAFLEALACAKPVISYFIPEIHEWCFNEMPPCCNASDEDGIYSWLKELVQNPKLREEFGNRGRQWIEKYNSSKQVATAYIGLYYDVMRNHPRRGIGV
jgi:glycosyltransferase involved in cell wall biosynthesis